MQKESDFSQGRNGMRERAGISFFIDKSVKQKLLFEPKASSVFVAFG